MADKTITTDLSSARRSGSWILFPKRVEGTNPEKMIYHREGNDEDCTMRLEKWLELPLYLVNQ